MPLSPDEIRILKLARDDAEHFVNRNKLVKAFKHAGAKVISGNGQLAVSYEGRRKYNVTLGHGDIYLGDSHPTFRQTLSEMAADLLQANNIT